MITVVCCKRSGKNADSLECGIKNAHDFDCDLSDLGFSRIIVGPDLKSMQIANIYQEYLGIPLLIDPSLGNCASLENISKAEKENRLCAKVVYFLSRYAFEGQNDLVIDDVKFINYLVNIIEGRSELGKFFVEPYRLYFIKIDINANIKCEQLTNAKNSEVYKIDIINKSFILKKSLSNNKGEDFIKLVNSVIVENKLNFLPNLLFCNHGPNYQVFSYLHGTHKFGPICDREINKLIEKVYKIYRSFSKIDCSKLNEIKIIDEIDSLVCDNTVYGKEWSEIKSNILKIDPVYQIVHYDLHRMNILFENNEINILDLDSFTYAPDFFQPASLFVSLLFEDENISLEEMILKWPDELNHGHILIGMLTRILYGITFFEKKDKLLNLENDDILILDRYRTLWEKCLKMSRDVG